MNEILWRGTVNGRISRIWHDGHTDFMNSHGLYERTSDANPVIATAIDQLIEKAKQDTETIRKLKERLWRSGDRRAYE